MASRGGVVRALIGVAVSVITLWVIIHGVDLGKVAGIIGTATASWLVLMLVCVVVDLTFRAIRWQRLLAPVRRVPVRRNFLYLLVGYLANNVLPARLGELVRCHYLGDREGISRTTTLGTVVVERIVDTAVVVSIASLAIVVLQVRGLVASAVLFGLAVTALGVVLLAVLITAHRLPGAERIVAFAERWPRVAEIGRKLHGGLAVAGRPRTLIEALALSGLAWGATVISFAAAGQAIGVELSTAQAALLASCVALATAIPAGPGNLGTFDLAGVLIASSFGLDREKAIALIVLAHAASIVVTSVGGAGALIRLGWTPSAMSTMSEAESG